MVLLWCLLLYVVLKDEAESLLNKFQVYFQCIMFCCSFVVVFLNLRCCKLSLNFSVSVNGKIC